MNPESQTQRLRHEAGREPGNRSWTQPPPRRGPGLGGAWATLETIPAGRSETPPEAAHVIRIHLGEPVIARCRIDGLGQRDRRQVRGDIDVSPMGAPGWWRGDAAADLLVFRVTPAALASAAEALGLDAARTALPPRLQARDAVLAQIFFAMEAEMSSGRPADRRVLETLATAATACLVRGLAVAKIGAERQTLAPRKLRRVQDFVETHIGERLSVIDLAEVAQVSVSHFATLFRRATGESVHRYVLRRRVERARDLLLSGEGPISQVAAELGFSHQSHLAHCMRRRLGLSPRQVARLGGA